VYAHGGGYSIGDKSQQVSDKITLFDAEGWVFASINYRLAPNPPDLSNAARIKYPSAQHDAAAALAWLLSRHPPA